MDEVARDMEGFKADVVSDVARAGSIPPSSLRASSLQGGSILVHLSMAANCVDSGGRPAQDVAQRLSEQARDRSSPLFKGKRTSKTISLEIVSRDLPKPINPPLAPPPATVHCQCVQPQSAEMDGSHKQDERQMSPEEERRVRAEEKRRKFLQATGSRPAALEKVRAIAVEASSDPIGIDISYAINLRPVGVFITDLKPDGAAQQSGRLFKGDVITGIDGKALTFAVSKAEVAALLSGPPSTEVTLDVLRPNSKSGLSEPAQVVIRRLLVPVPAARRKSSVKGSIVAGSAWDPEDMMYDDIPFYDDVPVDNSTEIPERSAPPEAPLDSESVTQAEWARRMLQQEGTKNKRTVHDVNLDAVRQQAQWAREQLNSTPEHAETTKFDASSVAQQAQWAKQQLSKTEEQDKVTKFDSTSVAQQAQWAKEQLHNLPEHNHCHGPPKFDGALVAQQAQWAKEQLNNLPERAKESKFDATSVSQQAQWAKKQLSNLQGRE
jgi:hypothetical protein